MFFSLQHQSSKKNHNKITALDLSEASREMTITLSSGNANCCASIFFREGCYWIDDLSGSGELYLNNFLVRKPELLREGDYLQIGNAYFAFVRWGHEMQSCD
ncbi:MAG: FHA domain-containing protein [Clostridiales bacterium]|nr:FHA domain-containing protein [Clostridiales bacterium]